MYKNPVLLNKTLVIGIIFLLIGLLANPSIGAIVDRESKIPLSIGKTLYVGGTGPGNYSTIQEAIDNASDLDTVFVYSGAYPEHVKIHISINLVGENKESTIIDAGGSGDVIYVTADNVTITGFSIINSGSNWPEAGIELHFIEHCIITGNIIRNCGHGILPYVTMDVKISWNTISDNDFGLYSVKTKYCNITKNIIQNNRRGIHLNAASFNEIKENNFIDNERHLDFYGAFRNKIDGNFWQRLINFGPKFLFGVPLLIIPILPGFIVDWHPASEPFDI
ncbi:MAG: right-handed parallel beta-helix repeat-containing protein [Thermoplasmatales archaeon]|nr:MAG: right-handed parallel beta-helix repeat-containing protein [Thermoplasmatales archaeon]